MNFKMTPVSEITSSAEELEVIDKMINEEKNESELKDLASETDFSNINESTGELNPIKSSEEIQNELDAQKELEMLEEKEKLRQEQEEALIEDLTEISLEDEPPFNSVEMTPANWKIHPTEDVNLIMCINSITNRQFEGTRKAFNILLRG